VTDSIAPPGADEVELTAFGPRYGECVVVHLGLGEWMIVDSSIGSDGEPTALSYLRRLGVDPAAQVLLIVATHWHDDHVRGLSTVVERCIKARFACSAGLMRREIIERIGQRHEPGRFGARMSSGVDEIRRTLEVLARGRGRPAPLWALERRELFHRHAGVNAIVTALSPSDRAISNAYREIASLVAATDRGRRVPRPRTDAAAVALWVEVGDAPLLLGSDVVDSTSSDLGWAGVLQSVLPVERKAEIFKVPHCGAADGFNRDVWDELVAPQAHAIISPCAIGPTVLPTADDLVRLSSVTSHLHITSLEHLQEPTGRIRAAEVLTGRVTLRRRIGSIGDWSVSHEAPAAAVVPV